MAGETIIKQDRTDIAIPLHCAFGAGGADVRSEDRNASANGQKVSFHGNKRAAYRRTEALTNSKG
jgi:hypothetical protein